MNEGQERFKNEGCECERQGRSGEEECVYDYPCPSVRPWQSPLLALMDKLRDAGPGAKVKLVIGRKRDYLIVTDKDGRPVE